MHYGIGNRKRDQRKNGRTSTFGNANEIGKLQGSSRVTGAHYLRSFSFNRV